MRPRDTEKRDMPEFQPSKSGSRLSALECPRCPHCQLRMPLSEISPLSPSYDLRTFECTRCDRISTRLVAKDPMNTAETRGYLASNLKPPG